MFKGKGERVEKLLNSRSYLTRKNSVGWMTAEIFSYYLRMAIKPYINIARMQPGYNNKKVLIIVDGFATHSYLKKS